MIEPAPTQPVPTQPPPTQPAPTEPVLTEPVPSQPVTTDPALTGTALLDAVAVMDRLRSPGGCPWDAAQTHESLAPYLLEETYETLDAIESGDPAHLREELGDLLLQVLFHARLTQELPEAQRFGINEVAADLVAKLVRRHPHVFAGTTVTGPAAVAANWDEIKKAEKGRTSPVEGIPLNLPALALATKLLSRSRRAGVEIDIPSEGIGGQLFALVAAAVEEGVDAELELRATALRFARAVQAADPGTSN
ncbi:MAG: mazg family protein [Pseudonocardiales bacterium]|nr:mazg family protein [Pseudonocardiales bacterium]